MEQPELQVLSGVTNFSHLLRTSGCLTSEKKLSYKVFVAFKISALEKNLSYLYLIY